MYARTEMLETLVPGRSFRGGKCSTGISRVHRGETTSIQSVGDPVGNDDSIRVLRGTPSEHHGGKPWLTHQVRHGTRSCKEIPTIAWRICCMNGGVER